MLNMKAWEKMRKQLRKSLLLYSLATFMIYSSSSDDGFSTSLLLMTFPLIFALIFAFLSSSS